MLCSPVLQRRWGHPAWHARDMRTLWLTPATHRTQPYLKTIRDSELLRRSVSLLLKGGRPPPPLSLGRGQDFSLTKRTARLTKGKFWSLLRTENGLTTDIFVVKCTGKGLVVKRPVRKKVGKFQVSSPPRLYFLWGILKVKVEISSGIEIFK